MRYKEVIKNLGAKIKQGREEVGLTQTGLIEKMQDRVDGSAFNRNKLSALENCGKTDIPESSKKYTLADISIRSLCSLSDILGVDLLYIFGRQDYKKLEYEDICKYTGLSEKAVRNLSSFALMGENGTLSVLNSLLESPYFQVAINSFAEAAFLKDRYTGINKAKECLEDQKVFSPDITDDVILGISALSEAEIQKQHGLSEDIRIKDASDFYSIQAEKYLVKALNKYKEEHNLL